MLRNEVAANFTIHDAIKFMSKLWVSESNVFPVSGKCWSTFDFTCRECYIKEVFLSTEVRKTLLAYNQGKRDGIRCSLHHIRARGDKFRRGKQKLGGQVSVFVQRWLNDDETIWRFRVFTKNEQTGLIWTKFLKIMFFGRKDTLRHLGWFLGTVWEFCCLVTLQPYCEAGFYFSTQWRRVRTTTVAYSVHCRYWFAEFGM